MTTAMQEKINFYHLSLQEQQVFMRNTYTQQSYFQKLFDSDQIELSCEQEAKALRHEIERLLLEKKIINEIIPLESLHENLSDDMRAYNFNDGINQISTYFYETDAKFQQVYYAFIRFLRLHFMQEAFWFQATPTIRIHCPNAKNSHHYPRYHSDIGYGHPPEEINLWMPLTAVCEGHGFRILSTAHSQKLLEKFQYNFSTLIESAIQDKVFSAFCDAISTPVTTELGKALAFDSRCIHTGEPLKSHTRVSMDIRILPVSQYEKMPFQYQGLGRRKVLFAPGHCYHEKNSDYFLKTLEIKT